ncbi:hypothetical protein GB881_06845 [Georgenia subflava]|uniref:PaaI family thioesterase n=1 Tax=Georgenia subflava TaxID=1622177 RepID=A0A6N7EIF5_9MICO|nr:hypothetical protein [Georgenia subflava]
MTVPHRFRGPTTSGNGGWVAGRLAALVGPGVVTVTLRRPPPLEEELATSGDEGDGVTLVHDGATVAEAQRTPEESLVPVEPVDPGRAVEAAAAYGGRERHPFPECFVCGPARRPGDGMRLTPGRLGDGRTACLWVPDPDLAGRSEMVWAALDCPGGWAAPIEGRPMVLGRMTAHVRATPAAGEECVVMGQVLGGEGRKVFTATSVYGEDGRTLGVARATWIVVPQAAADGAAG